MFIIEDYYLAVLFCFVTMLCWGSWANTQKLVQNDWQFELFYWDYVIGIVVISILMALTMGNVGDSGRPFMVDIQQVDMSNLINALIGGAVFNLANILLTAAIAAAGMAVAFPIGIGLALVIGVVINYILVSKGNLLLLSIGVILITVAIVVNAIAYQKHTGNRQGVNTQKWILISILAGVLMSTFYPFVASSMDLENFHQPAPGKMTPYSAFFIFALGIFFSNLFFNTYLMKKPLQNKSVTYDDYFSGSIYNHTIGILGGVIWGTGNLFNLIAAGKAGPAISYGLGQGATLVAALWGVLIWREFKGSNAKTNKLIGIMFICFVIGLSCIITAGT